jgi:hypothetical protein
VQALEHELYDLCTWQKNNALKIWQNTDICKI